MARLRVVCVLAAFAAVAALAGRTTAHDDDFDNDGIPDVVHAVDLGVESSNVYFVDLGVAWHHNPWECQWTTGCYWPVGEDDMEGYAAIRDQQLPGWPYWSRPAPQRWVKDSYLLKVAAPRPGGGVLRFGDEYTMVTRCLEADDGLSDLDCGHDAPNSRWEWTGETAGRAYAWHREIHDNDLTVIAAVCIDDIEGFMADYAGEIEFKTIVDPDPKKGVKGWHTTDLYGNPRHDVLDALGRGWTGEGETPRIALYDERLMGGTARFIWDEGHNQGPWLIEPAEHLLGADPITGEKVYTDPMSPDRLGSCWSDPVVVDDSVPWMAATVCQRASDFNLRVGNTDSYPWVDATGKPWYRALDHRSTPEATRLYRPLDWALLGFEEWEPLADAAVAAGLVWAVWPDDPDDPAYDSTGRSFADYGGKPVCILANG